MDYWNKLSIFKLFIYCYWLSWVVSINQNHFLCSRKGWTSKFLSRPTIRYSIINLERKYKRMADSPEERIGVPGVLGVGFSTYNCPFQAVCCHTALHRGRRYNRRISFKSFLKLIQNNLTTLLLAGYVKQFRLGSVIFLWRSAYV